jgi:hypothetical protein
MKKDREGEMRKKLSLRDMRGRSKNNKKER